MLTQRKGGGSYESEKLVMEQESSKNTNFDVKKGRLLFMKKRIVALIMMACMAVVLVVPVGATNDTDISEVRDQDEVSRQMLPYPQERNSFLGDHVTKIYKENSCSDIENNPEYQFLMQQTASELGVEPTDLKTISSYSIDEYTMLKNLKQQTDRDLRNRGYSDSDIKELRTLDYEQELMKRAMMSDDDLRNMGYSEDGIQKLRALGDNPSDSQLADASSLVIMSLSAVNGKHGHNNSLSWAVFTSSWYWTYNPISKFTDIVAIGWSEGFYLTPANQSSYTFSNLNYYSLTNGAYVNTTHPSIVNQLNAGAYIKFPMEDWPITKWAKSGSMGVKLTKQANILEMAAQIEYGHTSIGVNPGVSFSVGGSLGGGVGISFSKFTSSVGWAYRYLLL